MSQWQFRANPWLSLVAVAGFAALIALGLWQNQRADQKQQWIERYQQRAHLPPQNLDQEILLEQQQNWHYLPVTVTGHYQPQYTVLLDGKWRHNQLGSQIYTVFASQHGWLLVNRGWRANDTNPLLQPPRGEVTLRGLLAQPANPALNWQDSLPAQWPMRLQYLELAQLSEQLPQPLLSAVLLLDPAAAGGFERQWKPMQGRRMQPAIHQGYALTWFSLAGVLVLLYLLLTIKRVKP